MTHTGGYTPVRSAPRPAGPPSASGHGPQVQGEEKLRGRGGQVEGSVLAPPLPRWATLGRTPHIVSPGCPGYRMRGSSGLLRAHQGL